MLSVGNDELISILSLAPHRDWLTGRWSPPCKLPASGRPQKGVMLWFTVLWFYFLSFKQRMVHSLQGPYIHHMWSPRWEGLGHPQISGKLVCVWVQNLAFPPNEKTSSSEWKHACFRPLTWSPWDSFRITFCVAVAKAWTVFIVWCCWPQNWPKIPFQTFLLISHTLISGV